MIKQEERPRTLIAVGVMKRTNWDLIHLDCIPMGLEDLRYITSPGVTGDSGLGLSVASRRQRSACCHSKSER